MRILLLGAPGSGKGTQAKMLAERYQVRHLSSGDLFRNNPHLTNAEKEQMAAGQLLSRERVLDLIQKEITNVAGFVLDGYPRTIEQAADLESILSKEQPLKVLYLKVSDEEVIARLSGRLTCPECSAIFHKTKTPPKEEGVCDHCGHKLETRKDDQEDSIRKRLEVYHTQTSPLIEYYSKLGSLREIDGESKTPEQIQTTILSEIHPQE